MNDCDWRSLVFITTSTQVSDQRSAYKKLKKKKAEKEENTTVKLKLKQEINKKKKRIDLTNKFASAEVETVQHPVLVVLSSVHQF